MERANDLTIERLTEATIGEADVVVMAAYGSASRAAGLRRNLALQPDGWRLARLGGRAVGVAGAVDYGPFAYIGQVGVLPDEQRRGIASALMRDLLEWLAARGCPTALLDATPGGAALYTRLGFVSDDSVTVWWASTALVSASASAEGAAAALSVAPFTEADLPAVVAFDTPRFGADRRAVLARLLAERPGRAFVAREAPRDTTGRRDADATPVVGFLFAQETLLGPWMADASEAARALLVAAQALPFAEPPQVLTPAANGEAAPLLRAAGFQEARTLQHMRRGPAPLLARRRALYGQASFALG